MSGERHGGRDGPPPRASAGHPGEGGLSPAALPDGAPGPWAARPALRFTHLDKPLWPALGAPVRKAEYLRYLAAVAPFALPHLRGRPLVLTRYPHGCAGPGFYQKNVPPTAPAWLSRFSQISSAGRAVDYLVPRSEADLLWVGQQTALEFHPWLSTVAVPDCPDRAVIDLDPMPPSGFGDAVAVARVVQRLLAEAGLRSWLKTSGATGLHVFLPIRPTRPYREVAADIRALGRLVLCLLPDRVTLERRVELRGGRVYFDYLQNGPGKTLCGAYSPRPLPGAPVSTPIAWSELEGLTPEAFTIRSLPERLACAPEPWSDLPEAPPQDIQALGRFCAGQAAPGRRQG